MALDAVDSLSFKRGSEAGAYRRTDMNTDRENITMRCVFTCLIDTYMNTEIFCSAFSPDTLRVSGEPRRAKSLRVRVRVDKAHKNAAYHEILTIRVRVRAPIRVGLQEQIHIFYFTFIFTLFFKD